MKNNTSFGQQLMACIFLVSLVLQSCSKLTNPPIPIEKGQTNNSRELTNPMTIKQLFNQELTAKGDQLVTFYQHDGQLQADVAVAAPAGFSKTYTGLQVTIAKDIDLIQLPRLNKEAQKRLIHFNLPKLEQPGSIAIYRSGLLGGSNPGKDKGKEKIIEEEEREGGSEDEDNCYDEAEYFGEDHDDAGEYEGQVAALNEEQKQLIHVNLPKNEQPGYVGGMLSIPGYKLLDCLYEGTSSNIYRGVRLSDECPVVIKVSTQKALTEKKAQRFRHEFELGQQVHSPYVVRYLELKQDPAYGMALVMEDDQAVELTLMVPPTGFSNHEFLEIAIQIVEGLQAIHAANIIHNDLKLSNILIQPTTKAIKIIDFNRSSTLRQERHPTIPIMVGTLAYISPEQTGRVNRSVDYRTDFYSLGVIFYRLLCSQLPFTAQDTLGLIHQHLAKQPQPPHQYKPIIPLPLSQLVMKLLEKEAENRYQSCEGLLHDLTYCLSALKEMGTIPAFELGQKDFSSKLTLSQHLYGREREIKTLINAFERISEGKREGLMVAGQPGVGKTMLIQEIQQPIALKQGYFLTGKFDQLNKNVAYSALTQAFNGLIQQWLAEDEASITQWKTQLVTALGAQAPFLSKVVPALALLIGEQPDIAIADISQAKNLLNWVFQEFIRVCANASHPLVLFLDDLQWADQASLELMTYLLQQPNISHLLWIGAYRDTEVSASHPALQAIATLQEASIRIQTLTLAPLSLASLCQWIADSLRKPLTNIQPLAELIFQKTAGNPFFVKTFLQSLYDQQLLTFSPQTHWQWDLNKIGQHPATENVITLMTYQIQQLPPATQQALSIASCLGHRLAVSILQTAMACSQDAVYEALQPALNSGILIQTDNEVHFTHDRVQEAAYHLLADIEKAHTHLMIGQRLLASSTSDEALLLDIVAQFNRCRSLVADPQERLWIARLNLKAAQKVKQATAYVAALDYLYTISAWIGLEPLWQTDYSFAFTLHRELAEVEYLSGHMSSSQALITGILPRLQSTLDKVDIYHLLIIQKIMQGQQQKAIALGHQALQLLGSGLPLDHLTEFIQKTAPDLKQKLYHIPLSSLLDMPLVRDPEMQALFKILASMLSACYFSGSELFPAVVLMLVNLSLTYGHVPDACLGYMAYGHLLCARFEEYNLGYDLGQLSLQLTKKLRSPAQYGKCLMVMLSFIYPWSKSIQQLPALFHDAYEACLACGDLEFAGYCVANKITTLVNQGIPLSTVQQEVVPLLQFAYNTKHQLAAHTIQAVQRLLANLRGDTSDKSNFDINAIQEAQFIEACQQANSVYALCIYYILKAQAFYLYGHFNQAFDQLNLAKKSLVAIFGYYATANLNWYDSLIRLVLYPTASLENQQAYLEQIIQNQQQMQKWQANCPENFAHKYLLVEAELARVQGDYAQAEAHYDQAIELAGQHGFIQEQALAAELAAKYWLARGKYLGSQGYLNTAFNGYKQWGAKRKLMQFKAQYANLLKALAPPGLSQLAINEETTLSSNTLKLLDLSSILKASHTISSEIELPKLLCSMMQIIIENAGAQQGAVLFVEPDDSIFVQAEYASDGTITTLQKIPLVEWTNGAQGVIQQVKRLHQSVVIDDATMHEQFKMDAYISQAQAKSILCVPLLKHTELKAILYVENNLMTHAFTPERVQTVLILTAQMVISLENARYFAEQLALTRQLTEQSARVQMAEESLHALTHDLQLALQASKAGTWNWRIGTNQVTWDAANYVLFGLTPGGFKGTYEAVLACVHPDDRERFNQDIKRCIEQDIPHNMEYRVIWPDQSVHILASQGRVYRDKNRQPIKMAGVCLDITPRRQLEQERLEALQQAAEIQRQRAEEAEHYRKQQEEFIDTVCHEIRNPMTGIYGNVDFLKQIITALETFKATLPDAGQSALAVPLENLREITETIGHCIKHQKIIIDDVLDLSKLEAGKVGLVLKPFKLQTVIEEATRLFISQLAAKSLDLMVDLQKKAVVIKGDPDRLKIVLINLISNAIKFTEKGHVKISLKTQTIDSNHVGIMLSVEDTGIGMTPEEQSCLFQRFSRPLSSQYEGSGLGLAISKKLLDLMGGSIQVNSVKGQGSTFTIHLTFETTSLEEKINPLLPSKPTAPLPLPSRSKHILVVEDNIVNQKILRRQLEAAGYICMVADNGQKSLEAIGALEEVKTPEKWNLAGFDLILMDLEMPVMGGMEATQIIRQKEKQLAVAPIPIVGLSAYAREVYSEKAKQAGMNGYTTKPYRKEELYKIIQSLISGV